MGNLNINNTTYIIFFFYLFLVPVKTLANSKVSTPDILKVGKPLPEATLKSYGSDDVHIKDLMGKIKIISIVPKLNTPICDKQTHKFSETNGGLDKEIDIITLSTNTMEDQHQFSQKAKIHNLIFLSDKPDFLFGKKTGLLIDGLGVLRRTVIVADQNNIIRYVDFVPGGGLPNINKALKAAKKLLQIFKSKG